MQCSDLQHYLEAYLDLRLGRSRGAILRRHLAVCPDCRARVENLRQFEHDLQRQFRAMARASSVWNGLEPTLVRSAGLAEAPPSLPYFGDAPGPRALPPPSGIAAARVMHGAAAAPPPAASARPAAGRRWGRRLIGLLLAAAAAGTAGQLWRVWVAGQPASAEVRAFLAIQAGDAAVDFRTDDAGRLHGWLKSRLGEAIPEPPLPARFQLVGGRVERLAEAEVAAIVYQRDGETTLLFVTPRDQSAVAPPRPLQADMVDGVSHLRWEGARFAYALVSRLRADDLAAFAAVDGAPL